MENKTVNIKINGTSYSVPEKINILEACKLNSYHIPTLCYYKDLCEEGTCGVCVVEVAKEKTLKRACITEVYEGMDIKTNTPIVRETRKMVIEMILANHPKDCLSCDKSDYCSLKQLTYNFGIQEGKLQKTKAKDYQIDLTSPSFKRDLNKCILCRRCVKTCENVQAVNVIEVAERGMNCHISTFMDKGIGESFCTNCGQCLLVCPTGALTEVSELDGVWKALADPNKVVLVETAPAVRVAIGEEFGMPIGSLVTGKLAAALRRLNFTKIFDTQFTADLTIMEEGFELIGRIKKSLDPSNKVPLPMITSCSPGWIKFMEHFFPKALDHLSSCKSPQQMFGAIAKTYYAELMGIDPRNIVVVSIMPCVAKKYEAKRPEINSAFKYWKEKMNLKESDSFVDVDFVLTTREAARMMKEASIDFPSLKDESYDIPLGTSTGAGTIFGASGGVMEAALRTVYEVLSEQQLPRLDFEEVRGLTGIKTCNLDIPIKALGKTFTVKVAVASGLGNAKVLFEQVENGTSPYHFIEVMTCPGGCLSGGGQPYQNNTELLQKRHERQKRMEAVYLEDKRLPISKSHENPAIKAVYAEFLKEPNGELSHQLLHTHYIDRDLYELSKK